MANNKTKVDRIHDQMPRPFKTRYNPNWKSVIEAVGESDQKLTNLIEEVRRQLFVKTANRPYLDTLGSNVKVSRPRFVGMQDQEFRRYIPVLAYQPKQVKLVLDLLLDIFFFKDTTTSFTQSQAFAPFVLKNDWELEYTIDQNISERIVFKATDFTNISAATAEEIVGTINRQAQSSFAIVFDDRIQKKKFIRLFTNTIGSKGSIQITGGRANIGIQFAGYNQGSGSNTGTQWTISKIGDTVTFQHIAGTSPNLNQVKAGDIAIIDIPGNEGSFVIESINLTNSSFTFKNLFATSGSHTHTSSTKVSFVSPDKMVVFTNDTRSVVWEVSPGEIIVEMPASPPVVKRELIGSGHINGFVETVIDRISDTSLELSDATEWPLNNGKFILQPLSEIQTHILTGSEDFVQTKINNNRFDKRSVYSYSTKTGNILSGITPNLPSPAALFEKTILNATRLGSTVTVTTSTAHSFNAGESVRIQNTAGDVTINGSFVISTTPTTTTFTYSSLGAAVTNTGGVCRVERIGMASSGSFAYLSTALLDTGIFGPYIWNLEAPYVLSSRTTGIQTEIKAGNNARIVAIDSSNNILNEESFVIFDFGTEFEEGPVRLLYKPTSTSIQLDPAYVFKNNHDIGSSVTVINRRGAIVMQGLGKERAAYITDPAVARELLQDLMRQVKSVGIFIEFLIRYPQQLYSALDIYRSGDESLWPIGELD